MDGKRNTGRFCVVLIAAVASFALLFSGCGGGGGGGATLIPVTPSSAGKGNITATVQLTGQATARVGGQAATGAVNVTVTIQGVDSGTGAAFTPITAVYPVDLAQGFVHVSMSNVPAGVNHVLVAVVDLGGGQTETVKTLVPEVKPGETAIATADEMTTAVANTAIYYAAQQGVQLSAVPAAKIGSIQQAVVAYSATVPYSSMTPAAVTTFITNANVPAGISLSPATATIVTGQTLQYTATVYDANKTAIASATVSWSILPTSVGAVSASGLFTSSTAGMGTVTASYQTFSATATVSIITVCTADADCGDGLPLTLDTCVGPGTVNATCSHTAVACNTASDCNDSNALTIDACTAGGTASAACSHTAIACNTYSDCNDNVALTLDTCSNGGTASATCAHIAYACNGDSDCNDSNALTLDTCTAGGTASSACSHAPIACNTVSDCNDSNANTFDACTNGGTASAACTHAPIACNADADCDDSVANTRDTCTAGGTAAASCSHTTYAGKLSAGQHNVCSLMPDGTVKCWGENFYGQNGNGTSVTGPGAPVWPNATREQEMTLTPTTVLNVAGATQVSTGADHACALVAGGAVKCWGYNSSGQLGDGTSGADTNIPVNVVDGSGGLLSGVTQISAGGTHTCALMPNGGVKCWGWGAYGQLGNGGLNDSHVPVDVANGSGGLLTGAVSISATGEGTCALMAGGGMKCWGWNAYGQIGNGTTTNTNVPVDVVNGQGSLLTGVTAISISYYHTCALMAGGNVKCWGMNTSGQLGNGTTNNSSTPVDVIGVTGAAFISAGGSHTCAAMSDFTAKCWGDNYYEQLGNTDNLTSARRQESLPVSVNNVLGSITGVSVSEYDSFSCFNLSSGSFKCVGNGRYGQLGDGHAYYNPLPQSEFGITGVLGMSMRNDHACAVLNDGSLSCWGYNSYGQLGDGNDMGWARPVKALGITNAVKTAAGENFACAALADGKVDCWGYNNYGQVGDGSLSTRLIPVNVTASAGGSLTGAADVAAGKEHACALTATGEVVCWGRNANGELGNGSTTDSSRTVNVSNGSGGSLAGVTAITSGSTHVCALVPGGGVKCWGANNVGQLGTGGAGDSSVPVDVVNGQGGLLTGATAISSVGDHTCALVAGNVKCWGDNTSGQLGTGSAGGTSNVPVNVAGLSGTVVAVGAGNGYTCATIQGGSVQCWGLDYYLTLGAGDQYRTGPGALTPTTVQSLSGATNVAGGYIRTCANTANGLQCWGQDLFDYTDGL